MPGSSQSSQDQSHEAGASGFSIAGTDDKFTSKSADIFASLDNLEKKHEAAVDASDKRSSESLLKDDPRLDSFGPSKSRGGARGFGPSRESASQSDDGQGYHGVLDRHGNVKKSVVSDFKKPIGLPKKVPDHAKNPENYKFYDLSDVKVSNEKANSAAAFDFLKGARGSSAVDGGGDKALDEGSKITFKKPSTSTITRGFGSSKTVLDGKITMPEYVVGEKQAKKNEDAFVKKSKPSAAASCSAVGLGHLDDDAEEEIVSSEKEVAKPLFKKANKSKSHVRSKKSYDDDEDDLALASSTSGVKRSHDDHDDDDDSLQDDMETGSLEQSRAVLEQRRKKSKPKRFVRQQKPDVDEEEEDDDEEVGAVELEEEEDVDNLGDVEMIL